MTLKSNKGFALADTIIAIFVLVIFSTLVISISYNIYISSNFVKRNGQATNYIVEVFEYAKTLNFDDVLLPVAIKINTETAKEIIEQLQLHLGLHTTEDWELIEDELLEKISYLEEAIECKEETIDYLRNKNNKDYVPF